MKSIFKILFFVGLLLSFAACKKMKTNKLEGDWSYIPMTVADQSYDVTWTFLEGSSMYITTVNNNLGTTSVDTGTYVVKIQSFKTYLEIYDVTDGDNGKYLIDRVTGKYLELVQQTLGNGAETLTRKEFTKIK
jgi:hypothetical protein